MTSPLLDAEPAVEISHVKSPKSDTRSSTDFASRPGSPNECPARRCQSPRQRTPHSEALISKGPLVKPSVASVSPPSYIDSRQRCRRRYPRVNYIVVTDLVGHKLGVVSSFQTNKDVEVLLPELARRSQNRSVRSQGDWSVRRNRVVVQAWSIQHLGVCCMRHPILARHQFTRATGSGYRDRCVSRTPARLAH